MFFHLAKCSHRVANSYIKRLVSAEESCAPRKTKVLRMGGRGRQANILCSKQGVAVSAMVCS